MSTEAFDRGHGYVLQALLAKAVFRLDQRLQTSGGVFCFTSDSKCVFRLCVSRIRSPAVLDGSTTIPAGAAVAELHLWNEQLPALSEYESLIAWALSFSRRLSHSLRLLSAYMAERRDLDDVRAVRADMALGTTQMTERLLSLSGRYGFRPCSAHQGKAALARRFGEDILIAMMVLARNARAFRFSKFRRARVLVFMPRDVLDERFGAADRHPRPLS